MFEPASQQAEQIADLTRVLTIGGLLLFLFTMVLLALAMRKKERGRSIAPTLWVLGAGVALPAAVLGALFVYSELRTRAMDAPQPGNALVVSVVGHLWWWEIRYQRSAGQASVSANELRIPAGRPVTLALTSDDVLHSFWVPALGGKMDLVPGRLNRMTITAREPGVYRGQCAEYCGQQHARMALQVVVMAPEAFEQWLAVQERPAASPAGELTQRGRQLFLDTGCAACHGLRSEGEALVQAPRLGPDLTHVGSRLHLGAGLVPNSPAAMRQWVGNVQQFKPGARMPSFAHLEPQSLDALAAYLSGLE